MGIGLMEIEEARWVVDLLASDAQINSHVTDQANYVRALSKLMAVAENLDEVAHMLSIITNQAYYLNESIDWIESELIFEAQAVNVESRSTLILDELMQKGDGSDSSLDRYNARIRRFVSRN